MISLVSATVDSFTGELRDPMSSNGGSWWVTLPHHMSLETFRTAVRHGLTLVSTDVPNPSYVDPVLMFV
jgi:hypothetical protein